MHGRHAARGFHHQVGATPPGQVEHGFTASVRIGVVAVEKQGGPQSFAQRQALGRAPHHHDVARTTGPGEGNGKGTQRAGAKDKHCIAHGDGRQLKGVGHGRTRAAGRYQHSGVKGLVSVEDVCPRIEDDVRGIAAVEEGRLVNRAVDAIHPAVRAKGRFLDHRAVVARPARHPPVPQHSFAGTQRDTIHVALLPRHLDHTPHALVAQDDRPWRAWVVPTPHVYVRAAHPGCLDLYQHLPWLQGGHAHIPNC